MAVATARIGLASLGEAISTTEQIVIHRAGRATRPDTDNSTCFIGPIPTGSLTANIARSLHHQQDRHPARNYLGASALIQ